MKVFLGKDFKYVMSNGREKVKKISDFGYRVPLLKSLEIHVFVCFFVFYESHPHDTFSVSILYNRPFYYSFMLLSFTEKCLSY